MNTRPALVLALLSALSALCAAPATAASPQPSAIVASPVRGAQAGPHCRLTGGERIELAQGTPLDCCKANKGICGCRAGKIVCCDGTVSKDPNCTCHSDWGMEN